ncbi:MAG: hypothetical protein ACTJLL_04315 [Anaplasma sp.]
MFACNSDKRVLKPSLLTLFLFAVCGICITLFQVMPRVGHCAGGVTPDLFLKVPGRSNTENFFAIPEILVAFMPPGVSAFANVELVKVERWEYMSRQLGYVAGYVRRNPDDGRIQMCACTKWTYILDNALKEELERKRMYEEDEITNFADLSLDNRIAEACEYMNTWKGCVDIHPVTPDLPALCNGFARESRIHVLPLSFSKQSYFAPGVRVLTDEGHAKGYKAEDIYSGAYGDYVRTRGVKSIWCKGMIEQAFTGSEACKFPVEGENLASGYSVRRSGEEVCMDHVRLSGGRMVDCVPSATLLRPLVSGTPGDDKLNIKFWPCKDEKGADTSYCDLTMGVGEKDDVTGFSVLKPKFDLSKYEFVTKRVCTEQDVDEPSKCKEFKEVYDTDPKGNATCLVDLKFARGKFYVKRDGRNHWVSELPKVLVAHSRDVVSKKNLRCEDSKSLDLATMHQDEIDRMRIRGRFYRFVKQDQNTADSKNNDVLCQDNMHYVYDNDRVFEHRDTSRCSSKSREGVIAGHCKTRYISDDNHLPFFLSDGEEMSISAVTPLNESMQGLCVNNFPQHEYKYSEGGSSLAVGLNPGEQNKHLLEVNGDNTKCDFIKMEMWGGGESGSLSGDAKAGKSGEYVMGILKLDPKEKKYLIVDVGKGGDATLNAQGNSVGNNSGENTTVSLCDDIAATRCDLQLTAKGGGQRVANSSGYEKLVHYRVAEGRTQVAKDEVFVPYQDINFSEGKASAEQAGCLGGDAKDDKILTVKPGKYVGAGGCARADIKVLQSGAHGMVRLTCEKWSGDPGMVKEWEGSFCNKQMLEALNLFKQHASDKGLSENTKTFFADVASAPFCRNASTLPDFVQVVNSIAPTIRDAEVTLKNRKEATDWVNEKLAPLSAIVDKDAHVVGAYTHAQKILRGTEKGGKTEFLDGFTELLRSKVAVVADSGKIIDMLKSLGDYVGGKAQGVKNTFLALANDDFVEVGARSPEFVEWLESTSERVSDSDATFESKEEAKNWVDKVVTSLERVLSNDPKVLQAYKAALSVAKESQQDGDDEKTHTLPSIIQDLRELLGGAVTVARNVAQEVAELLEKLAKHAADNELGVESLFARIAKGDFPREAAQSDKFVRGLKSLVAIVDAERPMIVRDESGIRSTVADGLTSIRMLLDQDERIVQAYEKARYDASRPKRDDDPDAKTELIDGMAELIKSKIGVIEEMQKLFKRFEGVASQHATNEGDPNVVEDFVAFAKDTKIPEVAAGAPFKLRRLLQTIGRDFMPDSDPKPTPEAWENVRRRIEDTFLGGYGDTLLGHLPRYSGQGKDAKVEDGRHVLRRDFDKLIGLTKERNNENTHRKEFIRILTTFEVALEHLKIFDYYKNTADWKQLVDVGTSNAVSKSRCLAIGLNDFLRGVEAMIIAKEQGYGSHVPVGGELLQEVMGHDFQKCVTSVYGVESHVNQALREVAQKHKNDTGTDNGFLPTQRIMQSIIQSVSLESNDKEISSSEVRDIMAKIKHRVREVCWEDPECAGLRVIAHPQFLQNSRQELRHALKELSHVLEQKIYMPKSAPKILQKLGEQVFAAVQEEIVSASDRTPKIQLFMAQFMISPGSFDPDEDGEYRTFSKEELDKALLSVGYGNLTLPQIYGRVKAGIDKILSANTVDMLPHEGVKVEQGLAVTKALSRHAMEHNEGRVSPVFSPMNNKDFVAIAVGTPLFSFLSGHLLPALEGQVRTFATWQEANAWIEEVEKPMQEFVNNAEVLGAFRAYSEAYLKHRAYPENIARIFNRRSRFSVRVRSKNSDAQKSAEELQRLAIDYDKKLGKTNFTFQRQNPEQRRANVIGQFSQFYDHSSLMSALLMAKYGVPYAPAAAFYQGVRELLKSKVKVTQKS